MPTTISYILQLNSAVWSTAPGINGIRRAFNNRSSGNYGYHAQPSQREPD